MNLTRWALSQPYVILAATLGLSFLGIAAIPSIPTDVLPDFKTPVVVSFFSYPGLPTLDMEKSVTSRVERALTLAGRLDKQESRTLPGASVLKITFQPGTNPSSAMNDIVNLEASDMFHLPPGIEHPFTLRSEPANLPVILAAISGEGLSETELYKIGYYAVRNKMGGLAGVQIPHPFGGRFRQMMVYVDPDRLQAHDLTLTDVVTAVRESNLVLGSGTVRLGTTDYQVHAVNTLPGEEEIDAIPIAVRDGRPIFLRDVGAARDDAAIQTNIVRVNGERSVYCPLLREPGSNTIAVVDRIRDGIREEIPRMKDRGEIPAAAQVALVGDQSGYIRDAIANLQRQLLLGAALVAVVVAVFLRRWVPTVAILLLLPLSMVIGLLGLSWTGMTINVMTLGGLALAVGTVVDAGIVVVESISRRLDQGNTPAEAAQSGTAEVAAPVLAGTITTLAIFLPALFLTGMVRFLFEPLAVAAALAIGVSYLLAMTLLPAFAARFFRPAKPPAVPAGNGTVPTPRQVEAAAGRGIFGKLLSHVVSTPRRTVAVITLVAAATLLLLPAVGTELFPAVDDGSFEIRLRTLPGTRIEETEKLVAEVEAVIAEVIPKDEILTVLANIGLPVGKGAGFSTILSPNSGPDSAFLVVTLRNEGRGTSTADYVRTLRNTFAERFPRQQFLFRQGGIIQAALNEGAPVPITVQIAAGNLATARAFAEEVVPRVREVPGAVDVQIAQALDYPQLDVEVDRTRASYMGLSQQDVAENILTALGSSVGYAPTIWVDPVSGIDFFLGVQYATNEVENLDAIRNLPLAVETPTGPKNVPLSNLATIRRVNIPGEIAHYNISRVYDVLVNVDGRDVGAVATDIERVLATMDPPAGVTTTFRGPVVTMQEGTASLGWGLALATLLVYLVMLAQFRSFTDPLIIMLAVPLGLAGVVVALFITGTTFNIQSLLGTLMMIGIVVNNSILLVDQANHLLATGLSPHESAVAAGQTRLRPILMTSLTLLASMAPLCFPLAPGSEAMIPLARALVGGMVASTVLTLFLIPAVWVLLRGGRMQTMSTAC
jgi:multidrug efflux pump subunit AcrB